MVYVQYSGIFTVPMSMFCGYAISSLSILWCEASVNVNILWICRLVFDNPLVQSQCQCSCLMDILSHLLTIPGYSPLLTLLFCGYGILFLTIHGYRAYANFNVLWICHLISTIHGSGAHIDINICWLCLSFLAIQWYKACVNGNVEEICHLTATSPRDNFQIKS